MAVEVFLHLPTCLCPYPPACAPAPACARAQVPNSPLLPTAFMPMLRALVLAARPGAGGNPILAARIKDVLKRAIGGKPACDLSNGGPGFLGFRGGARALGSRGGARALGSRGGARALGSRGGARALGSRVAQQSSKSGPWFRVDAPSPHLTWLHNSGLCPPSPIPPPPGSLHLAAPLPPPGSSHLAPPPPQTTRSSSPG